MAPQRHPQTLWTWLRPVAFFDVSYFSVKQFACGLTLRVQQWAPRLPSVLNDLEHRGACVGLAGNNLELAGNGKP